MNMNSLNNSFEQKNDPHIPYYRKTYNGKYGLTQHNTTQHNTTTTTTTNHINHNTTTTTQQQHGKWKSCSD